MLRKCFLGELEPLRQPANSLAENFFAFGKSGGGFAPAHRTPLSNCAYDDSLIMILWRIIQVLKLSFNRLEELPEELAYITSLYETIPTFLCSAALIFLELQFTLCRQQLWLSHNELRFLPFELYRMTSLTELLCTSNPLMDLPPVEKNLFFQNARLGSDKRNVSNVGGRV